MKKQKINWEDVKDELCYCGALKSEHNGFNGHGSCHITNCKQFTWKEFVYKTKEEKENPRKYAVMIDGCIMQFSDSNKITYAKETAESMAKTLDGVVVKINVIEVPCSE